jgi:hypothetical protein
VMHNLLDFGACGFADGGLDTTYSLYRYCCYVRAGYPSSPLWEARAGQFSSLRAMEIESSQLH